MAIHDDDCVKLCEGLALQAVNGYSVDNAHAALNMVDCISNQDIKITALALGEKSKLTKKLEVSWDTRME